MRVSSGPPGYVAEEVTENESDWESFGDSSDNHDGSYRLNGNPGSVNDFVRSTQNWTLPIFASATFDAGWNSYYPLIEIVEAEHESAIPDIGGLSNYLPSSS